MDIALVSMLFFQGFLSTNNQGLFTEVNRPALVAPDARAAAGALGVPMRVGVAQGSLGKCTQCIATGLVTSLRQDAADPTKFVCDAGHVITTVYKHTCTIPNCAFRTLGQ